MIDHGMVKVVALYLFHNIYYGYPYVYKFIKEYIMGYPTTIQLIVRDKGNQWYVNFPNAIAKAMNFAKGEIVEWEIKSEKQFLLTRTRKTNKLMERKRTDKWPVSKKSTTRLNGRT
jgi:antitoxin component of MazEF toxin-antitoxin module